MKSVLLHKERGRVRLAQGHDFGHDHGISDAERKKRQQKEFDAFIGRGKKTKKEEIEVTEKKKDDTYLEPDMKKRQANNEKARKELAKGPQMKNLKMKMMKHHILKTIW